MKIYLTLLLVFNIFQMAMAEDRPRIICAPQAEKLYNEGFELQKNNNTPKALEAYKKCLESEKACVACLYEIGWSYWKLGDWKKVVEHWEQAIKLDPQHDKIPQFLPSAQENLKLVNSGGRAQVFRDKTEILTNSLPKDSPIQLMFVSRWQSYNPSPQNPLDHFDIDIDSPKSVVFSPDGKWTYVHSLEGGKTVLFTSDGLKKIKTIRHEFTIENSQLIDPQAPFDYKFKVKKPQIFTGKPVESVFSHKQKYLWTTYYRRSFDSLGQEPSAVAVIDTEKNEIVRVMGTGPISKYVEISPDQKLLAISNWGDNTIGLYDISSEDFKNFKEKKLLIVQERLKLKNLAANRDKDCGFCVRGLAFSKDNRYLFAARMKGGGIAIFDLKPSATEQDPIYRGTVFGIQPGPRDLHMSKDGEYLYAGCNATGTLAKIKVSALLNLVKERQNAKVKINKGDLEYSKVFIGLGLRSFKLSPDNQYIFAAVNNASEVAIIKSADLTVLGRVPVDSYPVGLSVSPDGSYLWVTSQGKDRKGGNSVAIFQIKEFLKNQINK